MTLSPESHQARCYCPGPETLYWSPTSAQPHLFPAWQPEGASSAITCQSLSLTLLLRASGWLLSSHRVKAKGSGRPDPSTSVIHLLTRAPLTVVQPLPAAPEHAGLLCLWVSDAPQAATLLPQPCRPTPSHP